MITRPIYATVVVAAVALQACGGTSDAEPPVATPGLVFDREQVPLGGPIEATYSFVVGSDTPVLAEDYRVFVHFLDSDDELMWTDDHNPPIPTTLWKPGQTITYTRTRFLPMYPYIGEASVRMGLHSTRTQERVPLAGEHRDGRSYEVATLEVLPRSESIFLIHTDGWHSPEFLPDNIEVEWQWTAQEATIAFRNPKQESLFYLHLGGNRAVFETAQQVTIAIEDRTIDSFELTSSDAVIHKIPLSADDLGPAEMVELKIQVDQTFVPAQMPDGDSSDQRELGVRVFHTFVEPV